MKKFMIPIIFVFVVIFMVTFTLYFTNHIGISKSRIEKDARASQAISEDWDVAKETTETMSAMIFYSNDFNDYTYSIYIKKPGLYFGYFFRLGGSEFNIERGVAKISIEGHKEYAFISMNKQQINKVDIDDGNSIKFIEFDSKKPFVFILPDNTKKVTLYDINGNVIDEFLIEDVKGVKGTGLLTS